MTLGNGYWVERGIELDQQCVKVDVPVYTGASTALLKYTESISSYELDKVFKLELSAYAKLKIKRITIFKLDASIAYYKSVKETQYKQSHNFALNSKVSERRIDDVGYGSDLLTDEMREVHNRNITQFLEECGDSFIIKEDLNVGLYFSVVYDFASRLEKHEFKSKGALTKLPLGSLLFGRSVGKSIEKYRSKASLHVLQKGVDLSVIKEKLSEFEWDRNYGKLECGDIARCEEVSKRLFDYVSKDFVEMTKNNTNVTDDGITNIVPMQYKLLGLTMEDPSVTPKIIAVREKVKNLLDEYQKKQVFLEKLLSKSDNKYMVFNAVKIGWDPARLGAGMNNKLKNEIQPDIERFIDELEEMEVNCYGDNLEQCKDFEVPENLAIIANFEHAYIIKGLCGTEIYGPRYILPISADTYIEDTSTSVEKEVGGGSQLSNQDLVIQYRIQRYEDKIEIEANVIESLGIGGGYSGTCSYIAQKEEGYKLVDWYNIEDNISSECRYILCPNADTDINIRGELIYTETPI